MAEFEFDVIGYIQKLDDAWSELEQEKQEIKEKQEKLMQMTKPVENAMNVLRVAKDLSNEYVKSREENELLLQQLTDERRQRAEMETKLNEMSKLSAGVAKKTSQDDLVKALRIYLNISKRKTQGKREAAKTVIMEMLTSAKLELPDDIMEMLDHLDDEQPTAKVVNVQGDYNDIHDNGTVNQK